MTGRKPGGSLVVIDLQPAFSDPRSPWFTATLPHASRRIEALVEAFGERVVFTRFVPARPPAGSWVRYYEKWPFALQTQAEWLWALDARWSERPSLASPTFSKWGDALRQRCAGEPVVLCGVSTECCVLMTALAAVDDGADVRVVGDACAAKTPEMHAHALAIMATRAPQLRVVSVAEELALRT